MSTQHGTSQETKKLLPPGKLLGLIGGGLLMLQWIAISWYMLPGLRDPLGQSIVASYVTPVVIVCLLLTGILMALIYMILLQHYPDMLMDQTDRAEQREERRQRREGGDRRETDRRTPKS